MTDPNSLRHRRISIETQELTQTLYRRGPDADMLRGLWLCFFTPFSVAQVECSQDSDSLCHAPHMCVGGTAGSIGIRALRLSLGS